MLGVSEVVVSVLLLLITVLLAAAVVSTFFNVVYNPAQSQFCRRVQSRCARRG